MRVLCVVAHADDEALFMGATIAQLTRDGVPVRVFVMSDGVSSRTGATKRAAQRRAKHFQDACDVLGADGVLANVFPDQQSDTVPQLTINRAVEQEIRSWVPTHVYTHHVGDLNLDHRRVAEAVLVATRGFSGEVYSMAPEWPSRCVGPAWSPTIERAIQDAIAVKVDACKCYVDELRPYPHPRSEQAIRQQRSEWFQEIR